MKPYYADESVTLHHGDALDVLRTLPDASVDAVVTDPPYGLEFMGKDWDSFKQPGIGGNTAGMTATGYTDGSHRLARPSFLGSPNPTCRNCGGCQRGREGRAVRKCVCDQPDFPNATLPRMRAFQEWCEQWATECLRVLKPGGVMVAFGGTRTYHRLACAIEDAGFEIRDGIDWLYASGFPKSLNVGAAITKATGLDPSTDPWPAEAETWRGWGTALKPAREPIVMARKPLAGTVAGNVLAYGTGALNIDATRVDYLSEADRDQTRVPNKTFDGSNNNRHGAIRGDGRFEPAAGRWPSNVVLSHAPDCGEQCVPGCPVAELDRQSGVLTSGANPTRRGSDKFRDAYGDFKGQAECQPARGADSGGASRFFPVFRYEAKAPTAERPRVKVGGETGRVAGTPARTGRQCNVCGNRTVPPGGRPWPACGHEDWTAFKTEERAGEVVAHPTVKPLALMRWLVRLVTPPGGTVLEPFAGSGTTAEACILEGFRCIAIEREAAYLPLIVARLSKPLQPALDFGDAA